MSSNDVPGNTDKASRYAVSETLALMSTFVCCLIDSFGTIQVLCL